MVIVVLSDLHSGDAFGLADPANVPRQKPGHTFAKLLFDWYVEQIQDIGRVDAIILPGELLEGSGTKDTIELWTSDPEEQADACADLLTMWPCDVFHACYSSKYHDGRDTNTDHMLIRELRARGKTASVKTVQRRMVEGLEVNAVHRVGGSSTPYGFASQLMKAAATDVMRSWYNGYQPAKVYLRGHTHMHGFAGNDMATVINCPALKWPFGRYGRAIDRAYYTMGLTKLVINGPDDWDWGINRFRYRLPEEEYADIESE
jgi:hypothetical protein